MLLEHVTGYTRATADIPGAGSIFRKKRRTTVLGLHYTLGSGMLWPFLSRLAEDELKLPDGWKERLYTFNYVPTETEEKTGMVDELWTIAREARSLEPSTTRSGRISQGLASTTKNSSSHKIRKRKAA